MKIPMEFRKLARGFHQGIGEVASSVDDMVDIAVSLLEPEEYRPAAAYLAELIRRGPGDPELMTIWERASPDIYFSSGDDLYVVLKSLSSRLNGLVVGLS